MSTKITLAQLPSDILENIFSRIPCERTLLGSLAKVNHLFREITLQPSVRRAVQTYFAAEHEIQCSFCTRECPEVEVSAQERTVQMLSDYIRQITIKFDNRRRLCFEYPSEGYKVTNESKSVTVVFMHAHEPVKIT
eukprot:Rmarinus@m.4528